jgi:type I restriction enzyme S subunit
MNLSNAETFDVPEERGVGGANTPTPIGWVQTTLDAVAGWSSGGTPSRSNPEFFGGTVQWFKTGELGDSFVYESAEKLSAVGLAASSAKVFPGGAVALAMYGATIGQASILAIDAATNQACAVGVPRAVSSKFLYYFLLSQKKEFVEAGKGGAQPNISLGIVRGWRTLLPPAAEQTRIVEKLEELLSGLDAGVIELKAAQKKLEQYRQSLLKAAVGGALTADWRMSKAAASLESGAELLGRILRVRRARWEAYQLDEFKEHGKIPPKDWCARYLEPVPPNTAGLSTLPQGWVWASVEQLGDVQLGRQRSPDKLKGVNPTRYIRAANITEQGIDFSDVLKMDFSHRERKTFQLKGGDVLLTEASGSAQHVGRPVIWPNVEGLYCFQNTVIRFTPLGITPEFAFHLFLAWQKLGEFRRLSSGVGINHLSAGKFSALAVPLPSLVEQDELVTALSGAFETLTSQEQTIEHSLRQSAAQRKNILQDAFTGQLVPQDPADEPASVLLERIRTERAARAADATSPRRSARKTK